MIKVDDVLYLMDMSGEPIRALHNHMETQVEKEDGGICVLTTKIPYDNLITMKMQIIYRGERYIIANSADTRGSDGLISEITAESAYMELSDQYQDIEKADSTITAIVNDLLAEHPLWVAGTITPGGGRHSVSYEDTMQSDNNILGILRLIERWSDGELKLQFDTLNYRVNFIPSAAMNADFNIVHSVNMNGITRDVFMPTVTEITPTGNDNIGIESVTPDKKPYVENYDWFIEQGYTLEEARERHRKPKTMSDERYILPGNLMREAERRLETLSRPQIAYSTDIAYIGQSVDIGSYGYVQDEDLGIKVRVKVVRVIDYHDQRMNTVELNYLIPGIGDLAEDRAPSQGGMKIAMSKSDRTFTSMQDRDDILLQISITNLAAAHIGVKFWFHAIPSSSGAVIDGYFDIDGVKTGHIVKKTLPGYDTTGYAFTVPSVPEGSHVIRLMVRSNSGTFTVPAGLAELVIESEALASGMSSRAPVINYTEDVELAQPMYVVDTVSIVLTDVEP